VEHHDSSRTLALTGIRCEPEDVDEVVTELFARLHMPVHRYVRAIVGRDEDAQDVTQEAFIRLHAALKAGQSIDRVRGWLFRIAHNCAIDLQRRQGVQAADEESAAVGVEALEDLAPDAEERLLIRERHRHVIAGLAWLSPQERRCLALRAAGLNYREIGEVLNLRVSSVATFVMRGIKKIARALDG
jgi:RNA polymerase sigma-70 factor (ECF subfamily)